MLEYFYSMKGCYCSIMHGECAAASGVDLGNQGVDVNNFLSKFPAGGSYNIDRC